jgi:hypothetical protein
MQIKKFACGTVKATKDEMTAWALWRGYDVKNDHEADAVAIMLMAEAAVSRELEQLSWAIRLHPRHQA